MGFSKKGNSLNLNNNSINLSIENNSNYEVGSENLELNGNINNFVSNNDNSIPTAINNNNH